MKLHLFAGHLAAKRFKLFEHLKERSLQLRQLADASVDADKYVEKIKTLFAKLQAKFSDFNDEHNIAVFTNPFSFHGARVNTLPDYMQLELLELKSHAVLKSRFFELR